MHTRTAAQTLTARTHLSSQRRRVRSGSGISLTNRIHQSRSDAEASRLKGINTVETESLEYLEGKSKMENGYSCTVSQLKREEIETSDVKERKYQ